MWCLIVRFHLTFNLNLFIRKNIHSFIMAYNYFQKRPKASCSIYLDEIKGKECLDRILMMCWSYSGYIYRRCKHIGFLVFRQCIMYYMYCTPFPSCVGLWIATRGKCIVATSHTAPSFNKKSHEDWKIPTISTT